MDSSFISGMSLQLKLSSPTIDSTTDPATNDSLTTIGLSLSQSCSPGGQEESQDATVPTSFGIAQKELEETEDDQGDTWCTPTEKVIINESGLLAQKLELLSQKCTVQVKKVCKTSNFHTLF